MENKQKTLTTMFLVNVPAVILYYSLYQIPGIRPYANILYFCLMLGAGYWFAKEHFKIPLSPPFFKGERGGFYTLLGTSLMVFLYMIMRVSFVVISKIPKLQGLIDLGLWSFFVRPWHEINLLVSITGVVVIVFAVEMFYRVYVQNTLNVYFDKKTAIFLASLTSGVRACTLGPVSGLVDFSLALIWGWVYAESGFVSAVVVHMVWDVLFVYFPAK